MGRSLAPEEAATPAPPWLSQSQARSFRRVLTALRRYGGALLADPIGSGKTYVALAVAREWNGHQSTVCLVPAGLAGQWEAVAHRLGVPIRLHSHERVSRGRLPEAGGGLVLVDESHHFRNPGTRRYRHLACWIMGRPALLISATPVVNRLRDAAHQLLLAVRDDALRSAGPASLEDGLRRGTPHPALAELIIAGPPEAVSLPSRRERAVELTEAPPPAVIQGLDQLVLSTDSGIAALIRGVLWRSAASSPAALLVALTRYRRLLRQANEARASGRPLSRTDLHRLTVGAEDQLVMWELLVPVAGEGGETVGELVPADLPVVEQLLEEVRPLSHLADPKAECLRRLLADRRSTLVFTVSYDTVRYLRDRLDQPGLAWCTGTRAGIGRTVLPRASVLSWFQPESDTEHPRRGDGSHAPRHLISTDVTAEGLNLQRAERVVHYDLPWTRVRMTQRDGRTVRRGSFHSEIEVVRFDPPPLIEQRLLVTRLLETKAELSVRAGLADRGGRPWQWRDRLAEAVGGGAAVAGVAQVRSQHGGVLAGFRLCLGGETGNWPLPPAVLLWLAPDGTWSEDPDFLRDRLLEAMGDGAGATPPAHQIEAAVAGLAAPIRERLRLAARDRWFASPLAPEARRLVRRLRGLAGRAARRRDASALRIIDRALRFAAGGHTAGEAALVRRLAWLPDRVLRGSLAVLPAPAADLPGMEPRLTGLITFSPCRSSPPSCSTSTER